MRRLILALAVLFLAPTALIALTSGGGLVGDPESGAAGDSVQKRQIPSGGVAGGSKGRFLGGNDILARGDMSGTGGGAGGMKGAMRGGRTGGMHGGGPGGGGPGGGGPGGGGPAGGGPGGGGPGGGPGGPRR
jgi:hypothetical protein